MMLNDFKIEARLVKTLLLSHFTNRDYRPFIDPVLMCPLLE